MLKVKALAVIAGLLAAVFPARANAQTAACGIAANTVAAVENLLVQVAQAPDANGGIFAPSRVWLAIVDRQGKLCAVTNTGNDPWPSGRTTAIALAGTANGLSNSGLALSTANLYAGALPGGEFFGLNTTMPFNPTFDQQGSGTGFVPGGTATIGGGVALYAAGSVIGGLGIAGDSACASHAVAYRIRRLAGLDGIPGGAGASGTDNISYAPVGATPTGFQHPHCFPTDITP